MDKMIEFQKYYDISVEMVRLYDKLVYLMVYENKSDIDCQNMEIILNRIKDLLNIETEMYDDLTIEDINCFLDIIHSKNSDELKFADIRINSKLAVLYDKMYGKTVLNDGVIACLSKDLNFGMMDLVASKIAIDVYKLLNKKLKSVSVFDSKSIMYANKLKSMNIQYLVFKLSLNEVSENLGLLYGYDIENIPFISNSLIENSFLIVFDDDIDFKKDIISKIFCYLISIVNEFKNLKMDIDDCDSIYDNLLYVSKFEVLLSYLDKGQLEFIFAYFDRIKTDNMIVSNNVKKLIKQQINSL